MFCKYPLKFCTYVQNAHRTWIYIYIYMCVCVYIYFLSFSIVLYPPLKMKISCLTSCIMVTVLRAKRELSMGITCNTLQLSACASAITSSNPPSAICCRKLKEQKPSFANTWKILTLRNLLALPMPLRLLTHVALHFPFARGTYVSTLSPFVSIFFSFCVVLCFASYQLGKSLWLCLSLVWCVTTLWLGVPCSVLVGFELITLMFNERNLLLLWLLWSLFVLLFKLAMKFESRIRKNKSINEKNIWMNFQVRRHFAHKCKVQGVFVKCHVK